MINTTQLRPLVFWAPFLLLVFSGIYSLVDTNGFLEGVRALNDWILAHFGWLFSAGTLFFVTLCVWVYFSPLSKVRIGGPQAMPLLTRWQWFSVTLCTTIAIGILFWATAEPLYHLHSPPGGVGAEANSPEAVRFAMSTMFMHWTFTPYSIYTVAGLMFALAYYNHHQPFSLGAMLFPLLGAQHTERGWSSLIDAVCLYSLVAGMAASLGAGMLTVAGGLKQYLGLSTTPVLLGFIALAIVGMFVVSAITGLLNGIRLLSNINMYAFFFIAGFALVAGPTLYLIQTGAVGLGDYVLHFLPRSLGLGLDQEWAGSWTTFYWANWLAWTPVTALFLGRVAVGYTVRDFIHVNLLYPSLFSIGWMIIFSGNTLHMDQSAGLFDILQDRGPEGVVYALFDHLPLADVTGLFFLGTAFLSYVAGADANTSAMSGLCSTGIFPESPEAPHWIKITWGAVIGLLAWVMVANAGIEGVKMASTLGGFPALFLILAVALGLVKMLIKSY